LDVLFGPIELNIRVIHDYQRLTLLHELLDLCLAPLVGRYDAF